MLTASILLLEHVSQRQGRELRRFPARNRHRASVRSHLRRHRGEDLFRSLPVLGPAVDTASRRLSRLRTNIQRRSDRSRQECLGVLEDHDQEVIVQLRCNGRKFLVFQTDNGELH